MTKPFESLKASIERAHATIRSDQTRRFLREFDARDSHPRFHFSDLDSRARECAEKPTLCRSCRLHDALMRQLRDAALKQHAQQLRGDRWIAELLRKRTQRTFELHLCSRDIPTRPHHHMQLKRSALERRASIRRTVRNKRTQPF